MREQLERERARADRLEDELREARERLLPWRRPVLCGQDLR
jgi:hypothetical protein